MNAVASAGRDAAERLLRPSVLLGGLAACVVCAAVAASHPEHGRAAADRALTSAVFGVALPLLAFLTAELAFSRDRVERALRTLARHGVSRRLAGLGIWLALAGALAAATLACALCALVSAYSLSDPRLWSDLGASTSIALLAGSAYAAWYTLAASFGSAGGGRKWLLVLDWLLGSATSWVALPWPRGHVRNLLGGTPVADLSQLASAGVLLVGTALALVIALARTAD